MMTVAQAENELSDAMDALIYARREVSDAHTRLDYAFLTLALANEANTAERELDLYSASASLLIRTQGMERALISYSVARTSLEAARAFHSGE